MGFTVKDTGNINEAENYIARLPHFIKITNRQTTLSAVRDCSAFGNQRENTAIKTKLNMLKQNGTTKQTLFLKSTCITDPFET